MDRPVGHAFISYVREDSHDVDRLQRTLEAAGVSVWRDTADLWPGEDWRVKIRRAITDNALVFIACSSSRSIARQKSYQNEELLLAIEQLRLRRPDDPWLIPVRFDDCEILDRELGGGRTLASIQRVDLFGDKRDMGIARLIMTILRILGRSHERQDTWQAGNVGTSPATPDEWARGAKEILATSQTHKSIPLESDGSGPSRLQERQAARSVEKDSADASEEDPLTRSGRNSKVMHVELLHGRYLVKWERSASKYFAIKDESARDGQGAYLLQEISSYPNSGEKIVRVDESGKHLLSIDANNLDWTFTFSSI